MYSQIIHHLHQNLFTGSYYHYLLYNMQINTSTKKIQKKTSENLENCINTGKTLKKKKKESTFV